MRNNPKLFMQMIPGGDMIKNEEKVYKERPMLARNRLYSKVKGKQNFQNFKKFEKVQVVP